MKRPRGLPTAGMATCYYPDEKPRRVRVLGVRRRTLPYKPTNPLSYYSVEVQEARCGECGAVTVSSCSLDGEWFVREALR